MVLEFDKINKVYGKKEVLKDFSCCISNGICGLLGPNGAGKTTLMNIIAGNLNADSGVICLDGQDISHRSVRFRERLGYMPQQQSLYPDFRVMRFLYYIAALRGISKNRAKKRIMQVIEMVELTDVAYQKIKTLSGGMRQRLLIAQAILDDPDILILDEPTAGLDPKQRITIRNLIGRISSDKIVIFATHVVSDIEYIADNILMIDNGRILRYGKRIDLLEEIHGKVFELTIKEQELPQILERYKVGNIIKGDGCLYVRILSEICPKDFHSTEVRPDLEDIYLWHFGSQV